jgi:hypothetical protein
LPAKAGRSMSSPLNGVITGAYTPRSCTGIRRL